MTFISAIMSVPLLAATGIYNPPVMRHGHCIAQPGSFDALYFRHPRHLLIVGVTLRDRSERGRSGDLSRLNRGVYDGSQASSLVGGI